MEKQAGLKEGQLGDRDVFNILDLDDDQCQELDDEQTTLLDAAQPEAPAEKPEKRSGPAKQPRSRHPGGQQGPFPVDALKRIQEEDAVEEITNPDDADAEDDPEVVEVAAV